MVKVKFEGKAEIEKRVKQLMQQTDSENPASKLYQVAADAAEVVATEIKSSASSKNVPHQILDDIFYTRQPKKYSSSGKRPITQLAGIRLRGRQKPYAKAYREWKAKYAMSKIRINKKKGIVKNRGTVNAGQLIGMSLATMFEFGTSKMRPRPFVKPAMNIARPKVRQILVDGFNSVLQDNTI